MLPLDSPRWKRLVHAYGTSSDVPAWIREFGSIDSHGCEAWLEGRLNEVLWGALCHQYTVYSATIASIPHFVDIADETSNVLLQHEALMFTGISYACSKTGVTGGADQDLLEWCSKSVAKARRILRRRISSCGTYANCVESLVALVATMDCPKIAMWLIGFVDGPISQACPTCGCEASISPEIDGALTTAPKFSFMESGEESRSGSDEDLEATEANAQHWLPELASSCPPLSRQLRKLIRSRIVCPQCGGEFAACSWMSKTRGSVACQYRAEAQICTPNDLS